MGADKLLVVGPMLILPIGSCVKMAVCAKGGEYQWKQTDWRNILHVKGTPDEYAGSWVDIYAPGNDIYNKDVFIRIGL